jgi:alkylation response protein AidB-like acyl-CoA dehydrogenase
VYLERTPERRMLFESALRYFRAHPSDPPWSEMGELGLIAAAVAEDRGGLGGSAADIVPICEAIGESGAQVPYFSSVLLPAAFCVRAAATHPEVLSAFLTGQSRLTVAHAERKLVFAPETPTTRADALGTQIEGRKRRVWDADRAQILIVSGKGSKGFAWHFVNACQPGVQIDTADIRDGISYASVSLAQAECVEICSGEAAHATLERSIALALAGVLAETVGAMARLNQLSLEWLAARSQFGRPLWSNQVLQHRAVDMFIALEESRSMLNLAVYACDQMCGTERWAALHAAKARVAGAARFVGQQAVHLHGAMGLTEELSVGPAYRRIEVLQAVFGGADYHTAAYAMLSPDSV